MSVARVTEIISASNKSFEDAVKEGIERANQTLDNIKEAWVASQRVVVEGGKIVEYRVTLTSRSYCADRAGGAKPRSPPRRLDRILDRPRSRARSRPRCVGCACERQPFPCAARRSHAIDVRQHAGSGEATG